MKIVGVIPSRFGSSRLPGKPLKDICGKPMVWWVYNSAKMANMLDEVYVATDDVRIEAVCQNYNIPVIMTSSIHKNGTERLSEVAKKIVADIYVTIQGDEPLTDYHDINYLVDLIIKDTKNCCYTLKIPYDDPVDVINSTTPKVVTDLDDNILLITRSPVPYPKAMLDYKIYKPLGLYAFKREILIKYPSLKTGPLEKAEEIELLRLIENGYKIKVKTVDSKTIAVDTEKDLEKVRNIISKKKEAYHE